MALTPHVAACLLTARDNADVSMEWVSVAIPGVKKRFLYLRFNGAVANRPYHGHRLTGPSGCLCGVEQKAGHNAGTSEAALAVHDESPAVLKFAREAWTKFGPRSQEAIIGGRAVGNGQAEPTQAHCPGARRQRLNGQLGQFLRLQ